MEYLLNINPGVLLIIIFTLLVIAIVAMVSSKRKDDLIVRCNKEVSYNKDAKDRALSSEKALNTISKNKTLKIEELIKDNQNLANANSQYEKLVDSVEDTILTHLRFIMPDGEVANNVKVKTVIEDDKIVKLEATIRRKIAGVYTQVPVKTILKRANS